MIVPDHWAEARVQHIRRGKQVTVRRFGWSMVSQDEAQALAETRAQEALAQLLEGASLQRRERRVGYNGSEGVPIREEVLARHGDDVVTRNSYGAHCLNTPRVLFADIDFGTGPALPYLLGVGLFLMATVVIASLTGVLEHHWLGVILVLLVMYPLARALQRASVSLRGGEQARAVRSARRWVARRPGSNLRLYRTPAGLRVIATHALFEPTDVATTKVFGALGVDRIYAAMCRNQNCFRARLTAKPWRIGIERHIKPRRRAWPLPPEALVERQPWIDQYERSSEDYAACSFLETVGNGLIHPEVRSTLRLHDELSGAMSRKPIA